jgi:hypothetical protein
MSKWEMFSRFGRKAANIAADKATEKTATTIVEQVGPLRVMGLVGAILILGGIAIEIAAWQFLAGTLFGIVTAVAIVMVFAGYALRGFKGFLVGLLVRGLKGIARGIIAFVRRRGPDPLDGTTDP